ncbi:hypothetical protein [Paeniglutamicibacter psychrophenolicus]|uniref:hypothetical protein n=1 Tax=Paeniglutamicibacter psychrophenolicus TaxID=257454 RepID=UPI00277DB7F4|nr:hypothetical protein [Paeniglutamicibacter psychrophenolicus]MDQ0092829.1 hypothetical protein [Paeniglutamicibacter psychrophenolicus]
MLGEEDGFRVEEELRLAEGGEPSPKFAGGPTRGSAPSIQMSHAERLLADSGAAERTE